MPSARYDPAGNIVNDAAAEVGLAPKADPFDGTDPAFVRLTRELKSLGRELVLRRNWTHLTKEWTFTTGAGEPSPGAGLYDLPADWVDMLDQTGWDRTRRRPLGGPLTEQEWQYLKAWQIGIPLTAVFRMKANQLWLYPQPPPDGVVIALEYMTRNWVSTGGGGTLDSDTVVGQTDVVYFDPALMVAGLKLKWRQDNGFDTAADQEAFDRLYHLAVDNDVASAVLNIAGSPLGLPRLETRFLDGLNAPDTGYGS